MAANALQTSASTGNILSQTTTRSPTAVRSPSAIGLGMSGLSVPTTSKAEKRRSINPGMSFNMDAAASSFTPEPRAPSPLRSSFNDQAQAQQPQETNSPTPGTGPSTPTPGPVQAKVPSPATSPAAASTPQLQPASPIPVATPADKSPDLSSDKSSPKSEATASTSGRAQTTTAETTPKSSDPSQDGHKSPAAVRPPLPPVERKGSQISVNGDAPLPRLDGAGLLPTMSFSLSDPDFAVLLNEMETPDGEAKKDAQQVPPTSDTGSGQVSDGEEAGPSAAGLSRSPNMNTLATAASGETVTPSMSRTLLSPSDQPTPSPANTLRRRGSKESIMSVRVEPDSSFQALAELVAGLKPGEDNKVSVDYTLLTEAIREHQTLKETADTLTSKYTGAKVSQPFIRVVLTT